MGSRVCQKQSTCFRQLQNSLWFAAVKTLIPWCSCADGPRLMLRRALPAQCWRRCRPPMYVVHVYCCLGKHSRLPPSCIKCVVGSTHPCELRRRNEGASARYSASDTISELGAVVNSSSVPSNCRMFLLAVRTAQHCVVFVTLVGQLYPSILNLLSSCPAKGSFPNSRPARQHPRRLYAEWTVVTRDYAQILITKASYGLHASATFSKCHLMSQISLDCKRAKITT